MQTLKFLGRGSAFNVKEGNTSAYYIDEKHLILIDCGEGIYERIKRNNLLEGIDKVTVVATHLNSDHIGSLSTLIYDLYYLKKIKPFIIFPNEELDKLLKMMGHSDEYFYHWISDMMIDLTENIELKAIKTRHIPGMNCYGYLMRMKNKIIYYSGDSCIIPERILRELHIIDELYQDVTSAHYDGNVHMSLQDLNETISEKSRDKIFCMHIDEKIDIDNLKEIGYNIVEVEKGGNANV